MAFEISLTSDKDSVKLGESFTVTYRCLGAYDTQIQSDNMINPVDLGSDYEVSGTMKFLPTWSGSFNVTLTGFGIVDQGKPGYDNNANCETNSAIVTVLVD
jgi:hypothetical protein